MLNAGRRLGKLGVGSSSLLEVDKSGAQFFNRNVLGLQKEILQLQEAGLIIGLADAWLLWC